LANENIACPASATPSLFEGVLARLETVTHQSGAALNPNDWRFAQAFEPRQPWARRFFQELRTRRWGRPFLKGTDTGEPADVDGIPWRNPPTDEREAGDRAMRLIMRLLFEDWRGAGRPRLPSAARAQRVTLRATREQLLERLQVLFRATSDDRPRRRRELAGVAEEYLGQPLEESHVARLAGRYPCRVVDRLLAHKARALRASTPS
jgi:hypothetical protein